jgi:hypothetical protein
VIVAGGWLHLVSSDSTLVLRIYSDKRNETVILFPGWRSGFMSLFSSASNLLPATNL